jgi:hypothetical protein
VTDPHTKQVVKVLTFIDSEMITKVKQGLLPADISRGDYFAFLEADYS